MKNPDRARLAPTALRFVDGPGALARIEDSPVPIELAAEGQSVLSWGYRIQFGAPTAWDVQVFTERGLPELSRYPASLLDESGLDTVVLCSKLRVNGQRLNGLALPERGTIYLDVGYPCRDTKGALSHTVHHELFHVMDETSLVPGLGDRAWSALNVSEKPYSVFRGAGPSRRPGFPSPYATTNPGEDKAEVYATMVSDPDEMSRLMAGDPVLTTKAARLRDRLTSRSPMFGSVLSEWGDWIQPITLETELAQLGISRESRTLAGHRFIWAGPHLAGDGKVPIESWVPFPAQR